MIMPWQLCGTFLLDTSIPARAARQRLGAAVLPWLLPKIGQLGGSNRRDLRDSNVSKRPNSPEVFAAGLTFMREGRCALLMKSDQVYRNPSN